MKMSAKETVLWICGVLAALCGVGGLVSGNVIGGLLMLVGGLLLMPPIMYQIGPRANIGQTLMITIVAVIILAGLLIGGQNQSDAEGESASASSTIEAESSVVEEPAAEVSSEPVPESDAVAEVPASSSVEPEPIEYDALQSLFLEIENGLTEDSLLSEISEAGLFYKIEENESSTFYKIAYTEGTAKLSHADLGDSLEISFYEDESIKKATYFNQDLFVAAYYVPSDEACYKYTDFSTSPDLREDGSKAGTAHTNYYEAESLEEALILALTIGEE